MIGTIFIIVFLVYLFMIAPWNEQSNEMRFYLEAKSVAGELCGTINQVSFMGNGFSRQLTLPAMLGAQLPYEMNVYNNAVEMTWNFGPNSQNKSYGCIINVRNISFLGGYPVFTVNKTDLMIKNDNGVVVIE